MQVYKYGPIEPKRPTGPSLRETILNDKKIKKILDDYIDCLTELVKMAPSLMPNSVLNDDVIFNLKANLRSLKAILNALKKNRVGNDIVAMYAVIAPRNQRPRNKRSGERENVDMYAPIEPRDKK